jgi:integrase
MYASWFSGAQCDAYRASRHKARIDHLAGALLARRYRPEVVRQHLHEWLTFTQYLDVHGVDVFRDVRDPALQAYLLARPTAASASRIRFVRASVRIFLEMDEAGQFARRIHGVVDPIPAWCSASIRQYLDALRDHEGLAARTIGKRRWLLVKFAESLTRVGLATLGDLTVRQVQDFCRSFTGLAVLTRRSQVGIVRGFLGWAHQEGVVPRDLSLAATGTRLYRLRTIPDVLTSAEVDQILSSVDRSSPIGRRDYAVLMLAARYGLRPGDIRQLSLDHLDWRRGVLTLRQAKTGRPLVLPLLPDVARAVSAYLRSGRPTTSRREVFVRHVAPFEPFVPANNLSTIMRGALRHAGLDGRPGRRGLYLFRHTLATRLLEAGHPFKTISDVLGHVCVDSTFGYAKVDLVHLRAAVLSEAEVG